jgi:hypothetical protein
MIQLTNFNSTKIGRFFVSDLMLKTPVQAVRRPRWAAWEISHVLHNGVAEQQSR